MLDASRRPLVLRYETVCIVPGFEYNELGKNLLGRRLVTVAVYSKEDAEKLLALPRVRSKWLPALWAALQQKSSHCFVSGLEMPSNEVRTPHRRRRISRPLERLVRGPSNAHVRRGYPRDGCGAALGSRLEQLETESEVTAVGRFGPGSIPASLSMLRTVWRLILRIPNFEFADDSWIRHRKNQRNHAY